MAVIETVAFLAQKARENTLEASVVLLVAVPIIYIVINEFIRSNARIKGMKGPRGLPLIGNLWDIRTNAADQYRHWAKKHGDVYQVQLGNVPVVIVNSASAAKSLFGQHSQALSSRPETYTFHKVVSSTAGTTIGTSPYSESLKRRRKGAASALNRPSVQTYVPLLDVETRDFIEELYIDGKAGTAAVDPMPMIQRLSLSLALSLNWGVRMSNRGELFEEITHVEEEVSRFRSTTGNYQDYVPLLRLNPFNFHSAKAREMRHRRDVYLTALNRGLEQRMKDGTYKPCIQANVMLDEEARLNAEELTSISLTMLSGGLDTLTTLVAWFIGLLVHKPEIQEKAIQEIRAFFGDNEPLCDSEDDQKCPYMVALVRESLRYFTVLRLALPRATVRDVVHNGITIPKGSTLFLNAWASNMDGNVWSDPEAFRPERWLEQPDAPLFTYGMGYRMCAGSLLANRELYLIYMRMINSFKIVKHDDFESDPVKGNADPTSLVALPKRYRAKFVPRNETALRKALDSTRQVESEKLRTRCLCVIVIFASECLFCSVAVIAPYRLMAKRAQPARRSILVTLPTNSFSGIATGIRTGDPVLFVVALMAVLSEFLPILLANVPYNLTQTKLTHDICARTSAGLLVLMAAVVVGSLFIRWPDMPVDPRSVGGAMWYVSESRWVSGLGGVAAMDKKERRKRIKELGGRWFYGNVLGMRGEQLGVEVEDGYRSGYGTGQTAEYRGPY